MNKRASQSTITPAPAKRGRPKTSKNSSQLSDANKSLNEYKGRYKKLRKTLKHVVEEQVFFEQSLTNAETELLEIERDNAFILDQLSNFIKVSDDSSNETDSSEDERDEEKSSKKSTFTLPSMSSISSSNSLLNPSTSLLASTISNSVPTVKRNSLPKSPTKGVSEAVKRHVEEKLNSKSNDDKLTLLEYIPDDIFSQDDDDDEATASSNNDEDLVIDEFNK
ncbi:unnamed protein product [Dimorphilus gyrociliatus]|uniref:INO80 complex subunit E N-terminal domain-containing protein n=1 Tax=Dimorphilus gyrociliatus TaxID=2664684 RepID=A0A7I8VCF0_9ANNE|nr:unnamed protein product [Dimorphilus gyrociliatus]